MPTGTGKTETMLSILIANQCNKLLVTVPSDALREQLYEKFVTLGVLHKFNIVSSLMFINGAKAAAVASSFISQLNVKVR